jgi:hypothetical protein
MFMAFSAATEKHCCSTTMLFASHGIADPTYGMFVLAENQFHQPESGYSVDSTTSGDSV